MSVETKLKELEVRYLREALENCKQCHNRSIKEECIQNCATRYTYFMELKEFVLKPMKSVSMGDVSKIERIV